MLPISDDRLKGAFDYWQRKAAGQAMPRRADLDPADIPKLLPHVMLVEVHGPSRYRYRLIGTANAQEQGVDATGRFLDEVLVGPEYRDHVLALYDECVRDRRPIYSESLFLSQPRGAVERHTKVLFLPLSADGETVNLVFVAQVYVYLDEAVRARHFIDARPYREIAHAAL
jgi:hypothetical protein